MPKALSVALRRLRRAVRPDAAVTPDAAVPPASFLIPAAAGKPIGPKDDRAELVRIRQERRAALRRTRRNDRASWRDTP